MGKYSHSSIIPSVQLQFTMCAVSGVDAILRSCWYLKTCKLHHVRYKAQPALSNRLPNSMHFILSLSLLPIHITIVTSSSLKLIYRAAQLHSSIRRCPHSSSHSENCCHSLYPTLAHCLHAYFIIQGHAPNFIIPDFSKLQESQTWLPI